MKTHLEVLQVAAFAGAALLFFLTSLFPARTLRTSAQQKESIGNQSVSDRAAPSVTAFTERVKQYVKLREQLEGKLPKLSSESKPEEIEAHQAAFAESIRTARAGAKPGDVFTPDIADLIRKAVREEFKGEKLKQLRADVLAADTKGVPLRVNALYPDTKESIEMPPTLLLKLPQLPKQMRYRFVGRHLLLVDREPHLIVDYLLDALPPGGTDAPKPAGDRSAARASGAIASPKITLPNKEGSVRFLVFGDSGTGKGPQQQLAEMMWICRAAFPFELVLMTGDNLYGGEDADDYGEKFERPYKPLLDAGVKFYASLGNHDLSNQRFYKHFNMDGKEYYSFKKGNARFIAINSNYMDKRQLKWLEEELAKSDADWKVCFFHHPPYSSGKQHGSDLELRKAIEPLFVKHGVKAAFVGHEHFYERIKPQKGVYYFITGGGGKLRAGDVKTTNMTEKSYDQDLHFMLVEIDGDQMHFQVISRTGKTIDSGVVNRR